MSNWKILAMASLIFIFLGCSNSDKCESGKTKSATENGTTVSLTLQGWETFKGAQYCKASANVNGQNATYYIQWDDKDEPKDMWAIVNNQEVHIKDGGTANNDANQTSNTQTSSNNSTNTFGSTTMNNNPYGNIDTTNTDSTSSYGTTSGSTTSANLDDLLAKVSGKCTAFTGECFEFSEVSNMIANLWCGEGNLGAGTCDTSLAKENGYCKNTLSGGGFYKVFGKTQAECNGSDESWQSL